ncbi:MAG: uroporphyrinogen decarboxylase family protein [Eubacteriales bacterium]
MKDLYQERISRIYDSLNHREPDVVPSLACLGTITIGFNDCTVKQVENDWQLSVENFLNTQKDLCTDAVYTAGVVFDSKFARTIGSEAHFVSEDGQTIQHHQQVPMAADEYEQLIANPESFIMNVLLPRTAKRLSKPYPEKKQAILEFMNHLNDKLAEWNTIEQRLKEEYGKPLMAPVVNAYPPLDFIFDYFRGFEGVAVDMRRQPEKLVEACEALLPFMWKNMGIPDDAKNVPEFPPFATMFHIPTFLSPKQFEKFFLPTYQKMVDRIHACGGKMIMFLEGSWDNKVEWLCSLPKDFIFGLCEADDIFKMKKLVGDNICLVGGMPLNKLRYGTVQENVDYTKHLVDELAPGGGYIFSSSRELLTKTDVNWENFKAAYRTVHDYGKR